ncbi:DUF2190 family protein (plasmid) [Pseudomonas sp. B26140]|uniref:DUF2190 family protein n=1 Tax=Pseudomonas sp. B26140 TaxID=3235112 RepID=UPI0037849022
MAGNYVGNAKTITMTSPTGGTTAGQPVIINDMVVIPHETTVKGQPFTASLGDAWTLPVTGAIKAGKIVNVLATGVLVAADTADSVRFGKLLTDATGGYAEALLIQ